MLLVDFTAFAQTDSMFLNHAVGMLGKQPAAEKVYLHLDKPNYPFGDTIWYKAYTVIGKHHQLSALSGVLYVELFTSKDSLVLRQTLHLVSGVAWGDIPLSKTLKQGNYRIRAYTNWMRNTGPDYFYDQRIRIGSIAPVLNTGKLKVKPDVQFFPEGGQLVDGIRSRVAIKAINSKGIGEDIKGTVEDNEGNVVADFTTQHLGMGVFALIPKSGKTYKARINIPGETEFTVELPKVQTEGYILALNNNEKDSIYIKVAVNDKVLNEQKNSTFYILAQNSGKVYYTSQGKLENLVYSAKVEKNRFPIGIVQFTLFSGSGEPLAERIAFVENATTLQLDLASNATGFTARQPVKISLEAKDNNNKPVEGTFSVAVINESRTGVDELAESTILNNLLLTSDLKGYIEQPNYYFTNANDQTRADLDGLMLTQGYRRFEWKKVLSNTYPPITYQPEKALELAGSIKTLSGKAVPNGNIALVAAKENIVKDTTTDLNGNFWFTDLSLSDTTKIILRARKQHNGSNVLIYVKQPDLPRIDEKNLPDDIYRDLSPSIRLAMQKNDADYRQRVKFDSLKKSRLLKEVKIRGNKPPKKPDLPYSANLNGSGRANQVIMGDQVGGCITLSDCLQGKVFGVKFSSDGTPHSTRGAIPPEMVVIIDGMIMPGSHLNDINANDISSIEVLRSGSYLAVYGSNASGGALVITTKRGGEDSYAIANADPKGIITYPFIGFYKARSFYSPKYTGLKNDTQISDMRSTIYWNPNIITDKDGKASFEYFNADTKGIYRVVVEGIDDNGNLGRQVYRYEVK
jgi:hypothetical protein